MKKIFCFSIALLMAVSLSLNVAAAQTSGLQIGSATAKAGEIVDVSLTLGGHNGFCYLELTPTYSEVLTLTSAENGSLISDMTGDRQLIWTSNEDVTDTGILATLHFKIADGTQPGSYPVSCTVRGCYNNNEDTVVLDVADGAVTVAEAEPMEVSFSNVTAAPGQSAEVAININNNPGFCYLELTPVYGKALTLTSADNGSLISDMTGDRQLIWTADGDMEQNGTLAVLHFDVDADAQPGEYEVSATLRGCYNAAEETVSACVVKGKITVACVTPGDMNGDGNVTSDDAIYLLKHVFSPASYPIAEGLNPDCNGSGEVDSDDAIYLLKYLFKPSNYPLS